jgi:uncharacterized protein (TIGR03083 family)
MSVDHDTHVDLLEAELQRTVQLADAVAPELPVPTCPGWTAADLWQHLGTVHRWAAEIVRTRSDVRISRSDIGLALPSDGNWGPWMADGAELLLAALRPTSGEEPVWVWGADSHVRWWSRRQLHETTVHDADVALAMGEGFEVAAEVAADGIDELLDNLPVRFGWPGARTPEGEATVHLHATDGAGGGQGEWMISLGDGTIRYDHGHGKGDVAVRGPLAELWFVVNRRKAVPDAEVEVLGDPEALDAFIAAASLG